MLQSSQVHGGGTPVTETHPKELFSQGFFQQSGHRNTQEVYEKNPKLVSGDFPGYS